jgi:hypothetical protein
VTPKPTGIRPATNYLETDILPAMPRLRPRREAFAQAIIRSAKTGASIAQCYEEAGYKTTGHASEVNASRMLKDAEVRSRIDELARPAVRKMAFTLETLSEEISETIRAAKAKGSHNTVLRAIELGAKLHGLLTEKISVEHSLGTRAEIMESIAKRFGQEAADVLSKALSDGPGAITDQRRALFARDVTPEKRRIDESSPELIAGQRRD